MTAVAVEGVWKYFGDYPALRDINMTVSAGACVALLGRNGAGKTTLLRMLAGLSLPAKGRVTVNGFDARHTTARRDTGVLGHGIAIYDELTALENLKLFASLYGVKDTEKAAMLWLDRTGLKEVRHATVREFSRGMRQRLAVARAFLHSPRLLLLDEPFTALDDRAVAVLQSVLRLALDEGRTVVMSTHQLREALEPATHVALLVRGKLAHFGDRTPEMLADPGWLYRSYGEG